MSAKGKDTRLAHGTPKRPYTAPRVVSYGHVKEIIQGGGGRMSDAGGNPPGGKSKSCWIAEALYGVEDPRTLLLRAWLAAAYAERRPGWPFIAVYRRLGRAVARLIRAGALPEALFRPLFDRLAAAAFDEWARNVAAARR